MARFKDDTNLNEKMIPFYHTPRGKQVFDHLYKVNVSPFSFSRYFHRMNVSRSIWKKSEARLMARAWDLNTCSCPP